MAITLQTISCYQINYTDTIFIKFNSFHYNQQISLIDSQIMERAPKIMTAIKNNIEVLNAKNLLNDRNKIKPQSFRVLLKSKSGNIEQIQDNKSVVSLSSHAKYQNSKLMNNTFTETSNSSIKDFVRNMRNKTQIPHEPLPNIQKSIQIPIQIPTKQVKNSTSFQKQRSQSAQEKKLNYSHTYSQFYGGKTTRSISSLEQVEKKIDILIEKKLSKTNYPHRNLNETQIAQIDNQIEQIVKALQRQYAESNNEQKLQNINKKIEILEKIMAQSMAQSQLAKKYYYKKINNKSQKFKKPVTNKYKFDLNLLKNKIKSLISLETNQVNTINLQSTNRASFLAPDKSSYPSKPQRDVYQFRNQPIHRSTYGRDFLVFGSVPSYPYKQAPSQIIPSLIVGDRHSSYQNQFTKKKIQKINFKELDCYRDKYKNVQVQFAQLSTRSNLSNGKKGRLAMQKLKQIETHRHKTQQTHYINHLSTQNKISYKGQENNIKSQIKHKNLYSLKYAYKATMHA